VLIPDQKSKLEDVGTQLPLYAIGEAGRDRGDREELCEIHQRRKIDARRQRNGLHDIAIGTFEPQRFSTRAAMR
jgi:hypothetical protein